MNWYNNFKQKSPLQRFLFILGVFFFVLFVTMGSIFVFWDKLIPSLDKVSLRISEQQRFYFGILLMIYGAYRFLKLMNKKDE